MFKNGLFACLLFPFFLYTTCVSNMDLRPAQNLPQLNAEFSFSTDYDHWEGDFTDYPVDGESVYELGWGWENLPASIICENGMVLEKGLFLSGNNHSDDLFMFARRKIEGLKPQTWYAVNVSILIESNVAENVIGIGGSPGESVYFKVGASTEEPQKVLINGFYHLTIDKGNQSQGGQNAAVVGNLANAAVDPGDPKYLPKALCTENALLVETNQQGEIWIFLGTDSGFEGTTKFYIAQITLQIELFNH